MKARGWARWLGIVAILAAGMASTADVRVMISAGFYGVYSELGPAFERASGHHLAALLRFLASPETAPVKVKAGLAQPSGK